jgi:hypothetical protein
MGNSANPADMRSRLLASALLVLVALGGAGLAVAADRPQTPEYRPELTWAIDQAARPYIEAAQVHLTTLDDALAGTSIAGRDVLSQLQALDLAAVRALLTSGAETVMAADQAVAELGAVVAESHSRIDRSRLGAATAERLGAIDTAFESANGVVASWALIEDRATVVSELINLLDRHDAQVMRATTAGRQSRWTEAIPEMKTAQPLLEKAQGIRDRLSPVADVSTLTDLLDRYAAHDAALLALYEHVADTGQQQGARFRELESAVADAQAALPSDKSVLAVIVSETAGSAIAEALVDLERVRGDVRAALDDEGGT